MEFEVKIVREGRGGSVYYTQDGKTIPFEWDITGVGFDIYVPTPDEWNKFCEQHNAVECKNRRTEILESLAEEVRKQKAKAAKVTIDDTGISFSLEGNWIYSLLSKILGV